MTLPRTPLQSRFGRRLFLLFVGCALLPILALALLSYRHVSGQLRMQSEIRLHQANKALGLAIIERLFLLDATLRSIPPSALTSSDPGSPRDRGHVTAPSTDARELEASRMMTAGLDLVVGRRFVALEFVTDGGERVPVFGRLEHNPLTGHARDADLALGLPLLMTERVNGPRSVDTSCGGWTAAGESRGR